MNPKAPSQSENVGPGRLAHALLIGGLISLVLNEVFRNVVTEIVGFGLTVIVVVFLGVVVQLRNSNRKAVFWIFSTDLKTLFLVTTVLCFCLSIWTTHWPMKLRFQLSKKSFVELVEQVELGEQVSVPRNVGFFRVNRIRRRQDGAFCFSVARDRGDFQGLAYCPERVSFNLWSQLPLGDKWYYIIVD